MSVALSGEASMTLRRFIIERDIPKVGTFERQQLREAAMKSNEVLNQLAPDIQWVESYVADDKTFCVYLAKDEQVIRKHADPASIVQVARQRWSSPRIADALEQRPGYEGLHELIDYATNRLGLESLEDPAFATYECTVNGPEAMAWLDA